MEKTAWFALERAIVVSFCIQTFIRSGADHLKSAPLISPGADSSIKEVAVMFTPRHAGLYLAIAGLGVFSFLGIYGQFSPLWATGFGGLLLIGIHDLVQTHHSVLRNYPILGHFRFMFEAIRPELRQYIVESETE